VRSGLDRRQFLKLAVAVAAGVPRRTGAVAPTLYNGIPVPARWPPRWPTLPLDPVTPPYLVDPPAVIPIDLGRQLFVDDFLVQETSLTRSFHRPDYFADNPILWPTTPWEKRDEMAERTKTRSNPAAMPFSDGVFYDPGDRLFKMWYMGGYSQNTCYATSADGIKWTKPTLDVVAGTNIVQALQRDSATVWLDLQDPDRTRRYKMSHWHDHYLELFASGDGVHWRQMGRTGLTGDRTTFFYNPFRNVWVFSLRSEQDDGPRHRLYWETPDFVHGARWSDSDWDGARWSGARWSDDSWS